MAKFKVGDMVRVNEKDDLYYHTRKGSEGKIESISRDGTYGIRFSKITGAPKATPCFFSEITENSLELMRPQTKKEKREAERKKAAEDRLYWNGVLFKDEKQTVKGVKITSAEFDEEKSLFYVRGVLSGFKEKPERFTIKLCIQNRGATVDFSAVE